VADLQPGRHAVTFYAKVVSSQISEATRVSGERLIIAEGVLGDETGVINFRIVGDYAAKLKAGQVVAIRNARSEVFQEHMRIELDRWGKVSEEKVNHYCFPICWSLKQESIGTVKTANNLSAQAYTTKRITVDRERN
jgi:hypothetical protein